MTDETRIKDTDVMPSWVDPREAVDLRDDADDFEDELIDEMRRKGIFVVG